MTSSWQPSNQPGTGDMLGDDSMIAKIDQAILDFWFTNPDDRAWAYGMTLLPLLALIASIINYL